MLCGKVVTKHVTKIIVTSRPLVMTQPTRIGQSTGGRGRDRAANYFKSACLGCFLTGRNSSVPFSKQRALCSLCFS